MKKLSFMILITILLFGCDSLKGPTGPQGEQGEQGEDGENAEITVISGTLHEGDIVDSSYWLIPTEQIPENWLVIVYVRAGLPYPWFEPDWDLLTDDEGITTVAIYKGETVSGYEYRIVKLN